VAFSVSMSVSDNAGHVKFVWAYSSVHSGERAISLYLNQHDCQPRFGLISCKSELSPTHASLRTEHLGAS